MTDFGVDGTRVVGFEAISIDTRVKLIGTRPFVIRDIEKCRGSGRLMVDVAEGYLVALLKKHLLAVVSLSDITRRVIVAVGQGQQQGESQRFTRVMAGVCETKKAIVVHLFGMDTVKVIEVPTELFTRPEDDVDNMDDEVEEDGD
jgi:hypothetical protein